MFIASDSGAIPVAMSRDFGRLRGAFFLRKREPDRCYGLLLNMLNGAVAILNYILTSFGVFSSTDNSFIKSFTPSRFVCEHQQAGKDQDRRPFHQQRPNFHLTVN